MVLVFGLALGASGCGRRARGIGLTDAGHPSDASNGSPDSSSPVDMHSVLDIGTSGGEVQLSRTPALAIPDDDTSGVSDIGAIGGSGCVIATVSLHVDITHTCAGDLNVDLTAPGGQNVAVFSDTGCSAAVPFDVTSAVTSDGSPSLSELVGSAGNGTWALHVTDTAAADTGTLNSWRVDVGCE